MTNSEFVTKVSKSNSLISFNELLQASFKFPITQLRELSNLDLILTDKKVKEISNVEDLFLYIEKRSRSLDIKQAKIKRAKKEQEIKNLIISYRQKFLDELKLNELSSKVLGYEFNQDQACVACGYIATTNGNCNC